MRGLHQLAARTAFPQSARQAIIVIMAINTYEQRLTADARWALSEGSDFFAGKGGVQEALRKIARRLSELGIPYAVAGGMALFHHGVRRFTEDVDILVTREALQQIHQALDGLGYLPPFKGSKHLRDADTGVKIEFLVTGDYPGDGKPKPVAFPEPGEIAMESDGIRYVNLPTLIELKIASGMTNPARLKDLADVQELIKRLQLPGELCTRLNPYVQEKYRELWDAVHQAPAETEE
jgi:Nucleotidyl transferase AbiEii toxin, Type IV TA system